MNSIWIIVKKELKRIFTDTRMIIGIFLPGILIFALYSIMGDAMTNFMSSGSSGYTIYVDNAPAEMSFAYFTSTDEITYNMYYDDPKSADEKINLLNTGEADLYVSFPEGFYATMQAYEVSSGTSAPVIAINYCAAKDTSSQACSIFTEFLNAYENGLINKFDVVANAHDDIEDVQSSVMSMLLPMLLLMLLFSGAMGICAESISGEKERGTIATLLITPVKRSNIAIGKIISLGLASLASAIVSFIGTVASLPKLMGGEISLSIYSPGTYVMIFAVVLVTSLLFTTILTMISTFAKTTKEATSLALPVMIIVTVIGILGFLDIGDSIAYSFIPVFNTLTSIKAILAQNVNYLGLGITIGSNIIYIAIGIFALSKMFNSEKIMFNI